MDESEIRSEALRDALAEVEFLIGSMTHPHGRRASYIDSRDEARIEALESAAAAIKSLNAVGA